MDNNCGIYIIEINNKYYVGSSSDLKGRESSHRSLLTRNIHCNIHLQRAYNKNKDFKFIIVETCDRDSLETMEKYWMNQTDVLEKGYNICPMPGSYTGMKMTEKCRKAICSSVKGKKQSPEHISKRISLRKIPIAQYKDNTLIQVWSSAKDASIALNCCNSEIGKCCKGKIKSVRGFQFKYL